MEKKYKFSAWQQQHQTPLSSQVFGFIATIVFALDFYIIFNDLADFLKHGGESNEEAPRRQGNLHAYTSCLIYIFQLTGNKLIILNDTDTCDLIEG